MPQENQVLRCFSCETFQVHIVKKAKNWECKICGAKQSFKRHYGKGTGKDCRNHVMKLNELRAKKPFFETEDEVPEEIPPESQPTQVAKKPISKWAQYLEETDSEDEPCKPEKKRSSCDDDEIGTELGADVFDSDQLNAAGNSTQTNTLEAEEKQIRKKSKNIFDSGLDNVEDILSFI